jgi:hypothetical protein
LQGNNDTLGFETTSLSRSAVKWDSRPSPLSAVPFFASAKNYTNWIKAKNMLLTVIVSSFYSEQSNMKHEQVRTNGKAE